jgi:hypothetical protein
MNAVEIFRLIFPEIDLNQRIWILSALKNCLGILLQYISNLLSPCDNGTLEYVGFVLWADTLWALRLTWWYWKLGTTIDLSDGHLNVTKELMELVLDQILADQIWPTLLVISIREYW